MTAEALLLGGLTSVTGALGVVVKLLWARSESDRKALKEVRLALEKLTEAKGKAEGQLIAFKSCPQGTCPFKAPLPTIPIQAPA